jgi:hypothetical protein
MLVSTVLGYKKFSLECTDIKIYLGYVFIFNY